MARTKMTTLFEPREGGQKWSYGHAPAPKPRSLADEQGEALWVACKTGLLNSAVALLESGSNIEYKKSTYDCHGWTALMAASSEGHFAVVEMLHQRGADCHAKSGTTTAFSLASRGGHLEIVHLLAKAGASLHDLDGAGNNALMAAAQKGNLLMVKALFELGVDPHLVNTLCGANAVWLASNAREKNLALVTFLSELGVNLHIEGNLSITLVYLDGAGNSIGVGGRVSPVLAAIPSLDIVRFLVSRGVNVHGQDSQGKNAILLTAECDDAAHSPALLDLFAERGVDVHALDEDGNNALLLAIPTGNMAVVKHLVAMGVDLHHRNGQGAGALLVASASSDSSRTEEATVAMIQTLVEMGVDIDEKDYEGNNAFICAGTSEHRIAVLSALADLGADISCANHLGKTVLHSMAENQCDFDDVVELLASLGVNLDAKDANGSTPLMVTAQFEMMKTFKALVAHGANANLTDNDGENALMYAVADSQLGDDGDPIIPLLIEKGIGINAVNNRGRTAFVLANGHGNYHIAERLIRDFGALVATVDFFGMDALHLAAFNHKPKTCCWLISLGLDPSGADGEGLTALTGYAWALSEDEDSFPPRPSPAEIARHVGQLKEARALYLELQRRNACWQRRKAALVFLASSGLRPMAREREAIKATQDRADKSLPLPPVDRSTKAANLAFLVQAVLGDEGLSRHVVMKL